MNIKLKVFPFSLKDKLKHGYKNLISGSIHIWDEMHQQFFTEVFFLLIEQTLSKDKSALSLKNQEKCFTSVGIDIKSCLIHVLTIVLKHGD
jgi:hypothetical protein